MLRSRCWITAGSVDVSVVDTWSCSYIARCGESRRSECRGERSPSTSVFDGGAGVAEAMSSSHSPRSFLSLQ